jgi:hypothetical protein
MYLLFFLGHHILRETGFQNESQTFFLIVALRTNDDRARLGPFLYPAAMASAAPNTPTSTRAAAMTNAAPNTPTLSPTPSPESAEPQPIQKQPFLSPEISSYFIAGGFAGAASRTVVSPLERLKIIQLGRLIFA